jgi:CRP-like cAMP-binding protein
MTLNSEILRQLDEQVHTALAAHDEVMLAQSHQSAACHATHSVSERLAKWLLFARDRTGSDTLELTQEFLAEMLAVRRTTVTVQALALQQAGFIRYRRGHVHIMDAEESQGGSL